jgi:hypothetical protein
MDARDLIGRRGEFIACTRLSDFCGNAIGYFRPYVLGEKCPLFDLLVELEGLTERVAYFFAQIKTTTKGSGKPTTRLSIDVSKTDVEKMARSPFPTYLLGIDEPREHAFVISMHGNMTGPLFSMPRTYPLNAGNLKILWDEVADYWAGLSAANRTSRFKW